MGFESGNTLVVNRVKLNDLGLTRLLSLLLFGSSFYGQTGCAIEHTAPGVFICFPSSSEASVPELFHLSAQGNALEGAKISHYVVFLDKTIAYESRLATPAQRLSIEVVLHFRSSHFDSLHRWSRNGDNQRASVPPLDESWILRTGQQPSKCCVRSVGPQGRPELVS